MKLKPVVTKVGLADGWTTKVAGIVRNVTVKVNKFVFLIDMLVTEIDNPRECEIILGRS